MAIEYCEICKDIEGSDEPNEARERCSSCNYLMCLAHLGYCQCSCQAKMCTRHHMLHDCTNSNRTDCFDRAKQSTAARALTRANQAIYAAEAFSATDHLLGAPTVAMKPQAISLNRFLNYAYPGTSVVLAELRRFDIPTEDSWEFVPFGDGAYTPIVLMALLPSAIQICINGAVISMQAGDTGSMAEVLEPEYQEYWYGAVLPAAERLGSVDIVSNPASADARECYDALGGQMGLALAAWFESIGELQPIQPRLFTQVSGTLLQVDQPLFLLGPWVNQSEEAIAHNNQELYEVARQRLMQQPGLNA